jgi:hypothetical protein
MSFWRSLRCNMWCLQPDPHGGNGGPLAGTCAVCVFGSVATHDLGSAVPLRLPRTHPCAQLACSLEHVHVLLGCVPSWWRGVGTRCRGAHLPRKSSGRPRRPRKAPLRRSTARYVDPRVGRQQATVGWQQLQAAVGHVVDVAELVRAAMKSRCRVGSHGQALRRALNMHTHFHTHTRTPAAGTPSASLSCSYPCMLRAASPGAAGRPAEQPQDCGRHSKGAPAGTLFRRPRALVPRVFVL